MNVLFEAVDNYFEDSYEDMFWNGTDKDYIYHSSNISSESEDGIQSEKAYFSDSKYDSQGYGNYTVRVLRKRLNIKYFDEDPCNENIPNGYDGIGYKKGMCNNYVIYSSVVNDFLEKC